MAQDMRSILLQMMMEKGLPGAGGGMPPRLPMRGMPTLNLQNPDEAADVTDTARQMMAPRDQPPMPVMDEEDPDNEPQIAPGMQGGLPPEVMQLASMGIRPGDLQQGNAMPRRMPDRAGGPEDVDPMESYGAPGDEEDPRFGPQDDSVRDETEGELADVRSKMGADDDDDDGATEWEGDRTPTQNDLDFIKEHPTDGNLASFFRAFPDWTAEDILMRGGNPSQSPDEYAASDEEWASTQRDRSTRIDER